MLPRRDFARLTQRLLHDRTSRSIARALGRYEHVDIAVVPYYFDDGSDDAERRRAAPAAVDASALRSPAVRVIIMGCGRVGILLTQELAKAGHEVAVIDKNPAAFDRLPPGFEARDDRRARVRSRRARGGRASRRPTPSSPSRAATTRTSSRPGSRASSTTCRRSIARIYDPMRAEIYERLNIPTVVDHPVGREADHADAHPRRARRSRRRSRAATCSGCGRGPAAPRRQAGLVAQRRREDPRGRRRPRRQRVHPRRVEHVPGRRLSPRVIVQKDAHETLDELAPTVGGALTCAS